MNLGETIKVIRKKNHIKKVVLAKEAGISLTGLYNIENNISFPTQGTIRKICDSLGISVAYLLMSTLTDEDIPAEKREAFHMLYPAMKNLG